MVEDHVPPSVLLIGGPNGAGKSTFADGLGHRDVRLRRFLNADTIARGLGGSEDASTVMRAGRLMLETMHALADAGESFSFEATLAGKSHARFMRSLRERGYFTELVFVGLDSAEASRDRVAQRVSRGGHDIPLADIMRRFHRVYRNLFETYLESVDAWTMYNNAGKSAYDLVAEKAADAEPLIHDPTQYARYRSFADADQG